MKPLPKELTPKKNNTAMKSLIDAIKRWLKQLQEKTWNGRKISVGVAIAALTLIVISLLNLTRQGYFSSSSTTPTNVINTTPVATNFRHPLTGVPSATQIASPAVYGVMVENSADAWPQAGVDKAFEVIEAPAEGGIPRFLTLFSGDAKVDKIGPVRSARPYYIDWASAYGALYAHVGGSPDALQTLLTTKNVLDLNEFFNQYQFWRSPDRSAPHNAYTSSDLLTRGLQKKYSDKSSWSYQTYSFKDDVALDTRPATTNDLVVNFGVAIYRATWKYDRATNTYARLQNGSAHLMDDGSKLIAHNVAVIATDIKTLDSYGRLSLRTIGEGNGYFAQDGLVKKITWKKPSATDIVRFYDEQGKEISLNAGQTWIEVVASLDQVTQ